MKGLSSPLCATQKSALFSSGSSTNADAAVPSCAYSSCGQQKIGFSGSSELPQAQANIVDTVASLRNRRLRHTANSSMPFAELPNEIQTQILSFTVPDQSYLNKRFNLFDRKARNRRWRDICSLIRTSKHLRAIARVAVRYYVDSVVKTFAHAVGSTQKTMDTLSGMKHPGEDAFAPDPSAWSRVLRSLCEYEHLFDTGLPFQRDRTTLKKMQEDWQTLICRHERR